MALMDNVKRLIMEDFREEDREVASRIAEILNPFMEQVVNTINGRLDFENMNRDLKEVIVTVDANGTPNQKTRFNAESGLIGTKVIRADNLTNTATYPETAPFISFTVLSNGLYEIRNIKGLQTNNRYRLVFEAIY